MLTHEICLDNEKFKRKPVNRQIGEISLRITQNEAEICVRDLASQLVQPNGKSWIPATFEGDRKNKNWRSQSLFALDFDNGITFEEVMKRLTEYGLSCTFAYTTFSNSLNLAKFRVVFQAQEAIIEPSFRDEIQLGLMALFPEVDKSCKDRARLFFGGQELIHEDYEYCLDIEKLIQAADFYSIKDSSRSNMARALQRRKKRLTSSESGSEKHSLYNTYIGGVENTSNIEKPRTTPKTVRGVDFHRLRQEIQILDEFMNPEKKLEHPQLLGLATNLRYIEGGQKIFKECLDANSAYAQEKHKIMAYCKAQDYYPMQLEKFSPYEEDWQYKTLLRAAKRKEVIRLEEYKTMTIEQARHKLRELIEQTIMPSNDTGIHVVKVPTAVGKTESCIGLENVVIGFPNHALKTEVSNRMQVEHLVVGHSELDR